MQCTEDTLNIDTYLRALNKNYENCTQDIYEKTFRDLGSGFVNKKKTIKDRHENKMKRLNEKRKSTIKLI